MPWPRTPRPFFCRKGGEGRAEGERAVLETIASHAHHVGAPGMPCQEFREVVPLAADAPVAIKCAQARVTPANLPCRATCNARRRAAPSSGVASELGRDHASSRADGRRATRVTARAWGGAGRADRREGRRQHPRTRARRACGAWGAWMRWPPRWCRQLSLQCGSRRCPRRLGPCCLGAPPSCHASAKEAQLAYKRKEASPKLSYR